MKIGLDLDGVVYDFANPFSLWAIKNGFAKHYNPKEYDAQKRYGWSHEEVEDYFRQFGELNPFLWIPMKETKQNLIDLLNRNEVYIISQRDWHKKGREQTMARFRNDRIIPFIRNDKVYIGGDKGLLSDMLGINLFIEDSPEQVRKILEKSKANILLIDAPYNQNLSDKRIKRRENFHELL